MRNASIEYDDDEARDIDDFNVSLVATVSTSESSADDDRGNLLLANAVRKRATDIHIDPRAGAARIRFRIDGVLQEVADLPIGAAQQLINQLKVMARLDPIVSELPLESRWSISIEDRPIDIRLTTIACHGGEKLHARLFDQSRRDLTLDGIGIPAKDLAVINDWKKAPKGIMLVTGPTGAGKTTTLYSVLRHFVDSNLNVITIEDPVEYELPGATQIQVDDAAGLTFSAGIRAMLRLDPDCILVGELRDSESADALTKLSASGHTVLSTLHSRDAVGAISTLREWGVKDGPLATMLDVIVNQRLLPRLCDSCRYFRKPTPHERDWFEHRRIEPPTELADANGCETCNSTGHHGRVGVYEVWRLTDEDRQKISRGENAQILANALKKRNHVSVEDAIRTTVMDGLVSLPSIELD